MPMKMMMKNMNKGQENPNFDIALDIAKTAGRVQGVFS